MLVCHFLFFLVETLNHSLKNSSASRVAETGKCFEEAISHHVDSNQFSQAAKLYQEMAELHLAQQQIDEAVDYYFKANDCFANANSATSGYQCLIKAADALVSQKQYTKAIKLYEKVAAQSYNDLGKWSVKEYFFKSLLACLANEQKEFVSNVEMCKTSLGKVWAIFFVCVVPFSSRVKIRNLFEFSRRCSACTVYGRVPSI